MSGRQGHFRSEHEQRRSDGHGVLNKHDAMQRHSGTSDRRWPRTCRPRLRGHVCPVRARIPAQHAGSPRCSPAVHGPEAAPNLLDHVAYRGRLRHIGIVVLHGHVVRSPSTWHRFSNLDPVAEAVEYYHRAVVGHSPRDAQTDAAGRAGHDCHAAVERSRCGGAGRSAEVMILVIKWSPTISAELRRRRGIWAIRTLCGQCRVPIEPMH
jgi:hypothetical protein